MSLRQLCQLECLLRISEITATRAFYAVKSWNKIDQMNHLELPWVVRAVLPEPELQTSQKWEAATANVP